jgi:hypothetical protein
MYSENLGRDTFTEFLNPIDNDDKPLYRPEGQDYRCVGCGGVIPGGMHVIPDVVRRGDDMIVVGIKATAGANGPVSHACGTCQSQFEDVNGPLAEARKQHNKVLREHALRAARDEDGGR